MSLVKQGYSDINTDKALFHELLHELKFWFPPMSASIEIPPTQKGKKNEIFKVKSEVWWKSGCLKFMKRKISVIYFKLNGGHFSTQNQIKKVPKVQEKVKPSEKFVVL